MNMEDNQMTDGCDHVTDEEDQHLQIEDQVEEDPLMPGAAVEIAAADVELGEMESSDDQSEYEDDYEEEEDEDDSLAALPPMEMPYPGTFVEREPDPTLPETVTLLTTDDGAKVYVVGTAHFSENSQVDVSQTIQKTQPDVVLVELCNSRVNILQLDEETLLQEAKNINFLKLKAAVKQSGLVQGIMYLLLLSMSAHLTKQLGMAPGGEFRRAFHEARRIPGCRIQLGDRPIQITLRRALGSLSWWLKIRLAWYIITSKEPISKEEVEKCKQKDLLEEMLREMTGEFPALSKVFVSERDIYLANSLRLAARPKPCPQAETGIMPAVVVGVVGIGHVPGIISNWETEADIEQLMRVPKGSMAGTMLKWTMRGALVGLFSWGCYRIVRLTSSFL